MSQKNPNPSQTKIDQTEFCFNCPVEFEAAAVEGGLPKFKMLAYNGGKMKLDGFYYPVAVELTGMKFDQVTPTRLNHDSGKGVGHTTEISADSGKLTASGLISRATEFASDVAQSGKNGFPWKASIGADIIKAQYIGEKQFAIVNGTKQTGPFYHVLKSQLKEISFVDSGADDKTKVTIAAKRKEPDMKKVKPDGSEVEIEQTEIEAEAPETMVPKQISTPAQPTEIHTADPVADIRAKAAAELERIADVHKLCEGFPAIQAKAVAEGWDATRCELEVLKAKRPEPVSARKDNAEAFPKTLEAAAMMSCGIKGETLIASYGEQPVNEADKRFRHIGLKQLLMEAAWANGYSERHFSDGDLGNILFYAAPQKNKLQAAFSSADVSGILSTVANKVLLDSFNHVDQSWRSISAIRDVKDFKRITSYRLLGNATYEKVGPDGELKHGNLSEESFGNQADTYGILLSITRRDIINDDLGAFNDRTRMIGRGAGTGFNNIFWAAFMDNATFFTADLGNYVSGADTALSIESLSSLVTTFLNQVDDNGDPLGVSPEILLVPNALKATAELIYKATAINETTTANKAKPNMNIHAGQYTPVVSPYLGNANFTGNSTTAHYLLGNPNAFPVIESCFLNGVEVPTVEQAQADFNLLGIQMRGFHDFGVEKQDGRGGIMSKGSA
jgi:hypothetical protein